MKSRISTIIFLVTCIPLLAQNDIKIISSDRGSIVIEYTPGYTDTTHIKINNNDYLKIDLEGGFYEKPEDWGMPAIPKRTINIGVPSEYGNTIRVLNTISKEIDAKLAPKPEMVKDKDLNSNIYKISSEYNRYEDKDELVSFGEYGIARGIPVQSIIISPVSYTPSKGSIKIYTQIVFQINFSSNQKITTSAGDNFLSGGILNYNTARSWRSQSNNNRLRKGIVNSVLSSGKWVKFEAPVEGIYKITRSMLSSYGIDAGTVDPRTIKIYNNGGKMLPENVNESYPTDLQENAIKVVGEEDGKFDDGDYILFYGRGIDFRDYDTTRRKIRRYFNLYSKQNYYFITSGGAQGRRMQDKPSLNETNAYIQISTAAFADWEKDEINKFGSGRYFLGDGFSPGNSYIYTNKLDYRISGTPINYSFRIVNVTSGYITLDIFENSNKIFSQNLSGNLRIDTYTSGMEHNINAMYIGDLPQNESLLKFQISSNSSETSAYLDFFEISYQKELKASNDSLIFYSKDTSSIIEYDLSNFSNSNIRVFDVSDYANVKSISNPKTLSGGEFRFQSGESSGKVSKYLAVGNDLFKTPVRPVEINNQNLHGIAEGAQYIIITDKNFNEQANELKNYRESEAEEKLSSIVVDVDQIYNEFSGGALDVSGIRNFIKYAYDSWIIQPSYVLLFGDGNYDYKNIEGNNNYIPPYENYDTVIYHLSEIKYDELYSFPMDDYYVMVDGNDSQMDLAIGRVPFQTINEAQIVVDKIKSYENNNDKDPWRNLITIVADDGPQEVGFDDRSTHTDQAENLANIYIPGSFDLDKIYLPAYPVVITGAGRTKPQVNEAIIAAINEGTLLLHYVGHGNDHVWAHESVFENTTSIPRLHNSRYFFLTVASCEFGYFDKTIVQSGSEQLLLKENSGAIGVFSATRPVYSPNNAALSYALYTYLLKSRDSLNMPITIGKAYVMTKNSRSDQNDKRFVLLCDPALRLLLPRYNASIDSINKYQLKNTTTSNPIQIKALSKTTIEGVINNPDNSIRNDFNGEAILSVYDSQRKVTIEQSGDKYNMVIPGGTIFRGRVTVTNGHFTSNFIVPKDISYQNENGKVILYFFNKNADGLGYTNNIIVGGTDSTIVNDGKGPDVEIYYDVPTASHSYLINPDSLIVRLTDETGINTTGTGVGHELEGILNDNINNPIDFTNYFTSDLNSGGKSGQINYPFNNIPPGDYKIEVKAWDVFNNFSSKISYFTVVSGDNLSVSNVYNYPNPFSGNTTFTFQQNLNTPLDLKIKIYTIAGRLIREIERNDVEESYVLVPWDGRDQDGNIIANGTYFYKLIVKTSDGKYNTNVIGKLAVIR